MTYSASPAASPGYCPRCGAQRAVSGRFFGSCGAPSSETPIPHQPRRRRSRLGTDSSRSGMTRESERPTMLVAERQLVLRSKRHLAPPRGHGRDRPAPSGSGRTWHGVVARFGCEVRVRGIERSVAVPSVVGFLDPRRYRPIRTVVPWLRTLAR